MHSVQNNLDEHRQNCINQTVMNTYWHILCYKV